MTGDQGEGVVGPESCGENAVLSASTWQGGEERKCVSPLPSFSNLPLEPLIGTFSQAESRG